MKATIVFIQALLLFGYAFGKLRNGYDLRLEDCKKSLLVIKEQLKNSNNLSKAKLRIVKKRMTELVNYISYYELTQQLLTQLSIISPDVYGEMDNLKDKRDRVTDIYVKLIPKDEGAMPLSAAAFFSQSSVDEDGHHSEYGEHSVSVKIGLTDNALQLLYHELGHVSHIVPNLAAYTKFYRTYYNGSGVHPSEIGHNAYDLSGKLARSYELRFRKDYATYLQSGGLRFRSMISLRQKQRKNHQYEIQQILLASQEREGVEIASADIR